MKIITNNLPKEVELPLYIASTQFPELSGTKIEVKYANIKTTMACRPKSSSIFHSRNNRTYLLLLNNNKGKQKVTLFEELPIEEQIGILSHELSHICDYQNKSMLHIVFNGIGYFFHSYRRKFEHKVDMIAIGHGFGWQLYYLRDYLLNRSDIQPAYKNYIRNIYMIPETIKTKINLQY
ncbi:MAG: hypothetical protein Q8880_08210 [Bacteroidota bacterium]|nr:hypothetical protein [Bacteroidota bacterium]